MINLKPMEKPLWEFTDDLGTFTSGGANRINTLYLPLCNNFPMMSSISPHLRGDIKTNFDSFLLEPVSRIGLNNLKSSRNFWLYIAPGKAWSATGVAKDSQIVKKDEFMLEAGLLWQKISRKNKKIGLAAEITSFIPSTGEPVEVMRVEIKNISSKIIKFIPTAAIPLFARGASNLHDHRHVTSLLSRVETGKSGIIVTPALSFDEKGHRKNQTSYFVFGVDEESNGPQYIYPTQEEFTGEASDLEAPEAVIYNRFPKNLNPQGKEPMGGLRFKSKTLAPRKSFSYIILMGIAKDKTEINSIFKKFNSPEKITTSLNTTKTFWQKKSYNNSINSGNVDFDNWFRWVNIQPELRKTFGCSFLPDFDYGKGGRGWRDLWQDCLSLILSSPEEVRPLLINNFSGVRIDGSNATIIGTGTGDFIADRNNIPRVWMDHGIWPLITTLLYIHQSQDINILLEETSYFRDNQLCRGREKDWDWKPEYGKCLKTKSSQIYKGTILEHLLIQNLVQFFNIGPHNNIRLEGADWNDGLDMAQEFGESVAFTAMYAQNLKDLCELLEKLKIENIVLLKEVKILVDSLAPLAINYDNVEQKQKTLNSYFQATKAEATGERISIPSADLISDLKKKSEWITKHIREAEWLKEGFFNGYYDNNKQKVEGKINGFIRMTLTGQVFPVMSGIATEKQTEILFKNCKKYLQDKELGGFRLNTDFKEERLSLGRAFSFVYGEKENGAFFNHMAVMFAYALYKQGFIEEGYEVINSIYQMARNTQKSRIYPGLPEYFNLQGRGMYSYLTGSASWFILTLLTQIFGIKGEYGDFVIQPKLSALQFKTKNAISMVCTFAGRKIEVLFVNPHKKNFGRYSIRKVEFNGKTAALDLKEARFFVRREDFLKLADKPSNIIKVTLD